MDQTFLNKPILLRTWKGVIKINPSEIIYAIADYQGIIIRLSDQNCESPLNLTTLELTLEEYPFFRIHRKYLINITFVMEYTKSNDKVKLNTGNEIIELPLSRRKKRCFLNAWYALYN